MSGRLIQTFLFNFIALLASVPALYASDFQSPRTAALGGAGHAGPLLNDSIYLNPSYTSLIHTYALGFNYLWYNGGARWDDGSHELSGHTMNLSLQDGRADIFQAGVGYTQRGDANMIHIGASKSFADRTGTGIGVKFFLPTDESRILIRDAIFSTTFIASDTLQFVAVVDNLFETDSGRARGLLREYILGSKINLKGIALIYFDPHLVPGLVDSYGHELGIEFVLGTDFFLRLGNFRNAAIPHQQGARGKGYGAGFGWLAPKLSFDFAITRTLEPIGETANTLGFTVYF